MTSDKKTRARIKELSALVVQWEARARRDAEAGRHMDAQQHQRRANDKRFEAYTLEQKLAEGAMK